MNHTIQYLFKKCGQMFDVNFSNQIQSKYCYLTG